LDIKTLSQITLIADVLKKMLTLTYARRLRGHVKNHVPLTHGVVARLFPAEDYSFIESMELKKNCYSINFIYRYNHRWHAQASGSSCDDNFEPGTEVKGTTLTSLSVKKLQGLWEAKCIG
jgi:hypothetical protein